MTDTTADRKLHQRISRVVALASGAVGLTLFVTAMFMTDADASMNVGGAGLVLGLFGLITWTLVD